MTRVRCASLLASAVTGLFAAGCSCAGPAQDDDDLLAGQDRLVDDDEISRLRVFHVALWQVAGDVDGNGRLDKRDADIVKKLAARPERKVPCAEVADVNYDGVVDQQDVAFLEKVTSRRDHVPARLIPPGNNCARRGTDIATRQGVPGDQVPILLFAQLGLSTPASIRVVSGPGTLRSGDAQLFWVDVDPAAPVGSRIEIEISTKEQLYLLAVSVVELGSGLLTGTAAARLAEEDAGEDGGIDAGVDAGADAGTDGGLDAGADGGVDAGTDAGTDGGTDGGPDGGPDAGSCPQRGKGCDALLVELKYEWYMRGLGDMPDRIKGIGCEIHVYDINNRFERPPDRHQIPDENGDPEWNMTEEEFATRLARWKEYQKAEINLLYAALQTHTDHLRAEKEIGIEVVSAHGSPRACPDCGSLSSVEGEVGIPRSRFIQTIYGGAFRHVCAWVMFDTSCYSGSTVRGFATVNNTGVCRCCQPEPLNPCFHAGWENDTALGSSTIAEEVINLTCGIDLSRFKDAVEAARAGSTNRVDRFLNRRQYASSYVDDGYGLRCP